MKKNGKQKNNYVGRFVYPYRWQIIGITFLSIAQSALQVLLAIAIKFVIDAALYGGNLFLWGGLLVINLVAIVAFYTAEQWCAGSCVDNFTAKLRRELMNAAIYSRDAKLQSYHSGELLSRGMEDVSTVSTGVMNALPLLAGQVTRLVGSFVAVVWLQPSVSLILVLMAAAMVGAGALLRPMAKRRQREVRVAEEAVLSNMQESFQQLELIQSLQAQEQINKRFDLRQQANLKARLRSRRWGVGGSGAVAGASYLGTGAVLLWGASQLIAKTITYGDMTSILELLSLFRGPVLGISGQWNRLMAVEVACERLLDMLDDGKVQQEPKMKEITPLAVVFENVTFSYPGEEQCVLERFNAEFPLNGWACLTGISGRGKSTLFKLILGLYAPQEGRVYLKTQEGDIPCSEKTRYLFAYVPQDYAMLSGTVLENLQLVAPQAQEQERRDAIHLAQADFIWDTTLGEKTYMGENNTGLSKGQIQRLAIARAILMDRKIFLLDECTSALDEQTEYAVIHNLQKLNKSAILVTHRPQVVETVENVKFIPMDK